MSIRIVGTSPTARRLRVACRGIEGNLVVLWGDARVADVVDLREGTRVVNGMRKLGAIGQLQAFAIAEVPTVRWTQDVHTARQLAVQDGLEVWGRDRAHTQGRDIVPYRGPQMSVSYGWDRKDFWVVRVPDVISEWRIHVWDGKTIGQGCKWHESPPEGLAGVVRSRRNGWVIRHDREAPKGVRPAAIAAVEAVGYDFGAVDVLYTSSGPVVLEVNSAPAVRDDYTVGRYLRAIDRSARRS